VIRRAGIGTALALVSLTLAAPAGAAVIAPSITEDVVLDSDGECSLREAVSSANTGNASGLPQGECPPGDDPGPDTIVLEDKIYEIQVAPAGIPHQGDLNNDDGDLNVTDDLTIDGQGPGSTVIQVLAPSRAIHVESPTFADLVLTIEGVRITGGNSIDGDSANPSAELGGAIFAINTTLTLSNCRFDDNHTGDGAPDGAAGPPGAGEGGSGGAVAVFGEELHVDGCTFDGNGTGNGGRGLDIAAGSGAGGSAAQGGDGGAIHMGPLDAARIGDTTFTNNFTGSGGDGGNAGPGPATPSNAFGGPGGAGGGGGAVSTGGSFPDHAMSDVTFTGNHTGDGGVGGVPVATGRAGPGGSGGSGGALSIVGGLTLNRVRATGNTAGDGGMAGSGPGSITSTAGAGGSGGAYVGLTLRLAVSESTFSGNSAGAGAPGGSVGAGSNPGPGGDGGGLWSNNNEISIERATIGGNSAGRGGASAGAGTGQGAAGGAGGGLVIRSPVTTLLNTTVSGNSSGEGGTRATSFGPGGAGGHGAGISKIGMGPLTANHVTVAGNVPGKDGANVGSNPQPASGGTAGAISLLAGSGPNVVGTASLTSSILAGNGPFACEGPISASTSDTIGFDAASPSCPGADVDPLLGTLADNGGPTLTHALAENSPALGIGVAGSCPATDQRGVARPQGTGCDAGAFEREVPPPASSPVPGPGGPAGGLPTDVLDPLVGFILRRQGLLAALENGYRVDFTTNERGTALVELLASGANAKGLKPIAAARTVRVARGSKRLVRTGRARVVAKFTRKARRTLRRRKRVRLVVRLSVTDAAKNKTVKRKRITLKR
jgi:hypothetical protein